MQCFSVGSIWISISIPALHHWHFQFHFFVYKRQIYVLFSQWKGIICISVRHICILTSLGWNVIIILICMNLKHNLSDATRVSFLNYIFFPQLLWEKVWIGVIHLNNKLNLNAHFHRKGLNVLFSNICKSKYSMHILK